MGELSCLVVLIALGGIVVLFFFAMSRRVEAAKQRLNAAWYAYQQSLAALKAAPTNADLKQQTLALGRQYSALTRENKQVTMFDEVALANDISAATAAATVAPAPAPTPASSVEERLRSLEALRTKRVITDAEYAARRQQLIESI